MFIPVGGIFLWIFLTFLFNLGSDDNWFPGRESND